MRKSSTISKRDSYLKHAELEYPEDKSFTELENILQKSEKTSQEKQLLFSYLKTISTLTELVTQFSENKVTLLSNICNHMKYEKVDSNKIFVRTGDDGNKFYFIIKGSIALLIPQCERIEMSEEEYMVYLSRLRKFDEYELLEKCKYQNNSVFPIEEDDLEDYLAKFYYLKKSFVYQTNKKYLTGDEQEKEISTQSLQLIFQELWNTVSTIESGHSEKRKTGPKKAVNFSDQLKEYPSVSSIQEYIKRISPTMIKGYLLEKKLVTIWRYKMVKILTKGENFGDMALHSYTGKRTATLITLENCHFGTLDKHSYDYCFKELIERYKKGNINFFLSTPIFDQYNKNLFVKHIFNYFVNTKSKRNQIISEEGVIQNKIFFLKEGEFEIRMKKSLIDINSIIKYLGGINKNEKEETNLINENVKFSKFMNEKRTYRVAIVRNSDIIGLDDCIYNLKNMFSLECISEKGEYFVIDSELLKNILKNDKKLILNTTKFIQTKKQYLLMRLLNFKEAKIKLFDNVLSGNIQKSKCSLYNINKSSNLDDNLTNKNNINNLKASQNQTISPIKSLYNLENLTKDVLTHLDLYKKPNLRDTKKRCSINIPNVTANYSGKALTQKAFHNNFIPERNRNKTFTQKSNDNRVDVIKRLLTNPEIEKAISSKLSGSKKNLQMLAGFTTSNLKLENVEEKIEISDKNVTNSPIKGTLSTIQVSNKKLTTYNSDNGEKCFYERIKTKDSFLPSKFNQSRNQFIDYLTMDNFDRAFNTEYYFSKIYCETYANEYKQSMGTKKLLFLKSSNISNKELKNRIGTANSKISINQLPFSPLKLSKRKFEFLITDKCIYKNNEPLIPELSIKYATPFAKSIDLSATKIKSRTRNLYSNVIKKNKSTIAKLKK